MKRRILSYIIALTLCLNLCPVRAFAAGGSAASDDFHIMTGDHGYAEPYEVSAFQIFNTSGYTFTGTGSSAIRVNGTGELHLTGTVIAPNGVGVEVLPGGFLSIPEPDTSITGESYALDIASGAQARLSTGAYAGKAAAIRTADGDYAALLGPGCAYFDGSGSPLPPANVKNARILTIGPCPGHPGKTCTRTPGAAEHAWTCPYCGTVETQACTFAFDQNGSGTCGSCENTITIAVDESTLGSLVYDGTDKTADVTLTVTLGDGTGLTENTDYTVDYSTRADAGEITVTVTGATFNGAFTRTYHVEQDQPGIKWDAAAKAVDYTGSPAASASLPYITITINASGEDLHPYLQYFWKAQGAADTEFTEGLPTNAGTYEVRAALPESQNYKAAETGLLTLTINKIPAAAAVPTAKTLTYSREAQELATAGVLKPGAAAEGAVIEFARAQGGPYSTDIPTGTGVSTYAVWYRVTDTENYAGQSG